MTSSLLQTKLDALLALHPKVIDLSLGRIETLLAKMGNPERFVPPVIHVAGTNGKGSTVAFLRAMLEAAGKKVHVYTSPHLVRFNERIVCAGLEIDDTRLINALDTVERVNAGDPITYFEITTAAAFLLFAEIPADVLLLEVGLGGRLDATNVALKKLLASVITPISFDHQDYLGDTLQKIAAEKAGIIKQGVPVISAAQKAPVRTVLAETAIAHNAPLMCAGLDYRFTQTTTGFTYHGTVWENLDLPPPALYGAYQYANAATAIATLEQLPVLGVTEHAIAQGVVAASWPARMQRLTTGRLKEYAGEQELWLDGSHNEAGAESLAETLKVWQEQGLPLVTLILGMLETKSVERFIAHIKPYLGQVYTVPIPRTPKAYSPEDLSVLLKEQGIDALPTQNIQQALQNAKNHGIENASNSKPPIVITGSLYLAGVVLAENAP
jgi:dihydrofolate synthase/folylpolyglutamate synthase